MGALDTGTDLSVALPRQKPTHAAPRPQRLCYPRAMVVRRLFVFAAFAAMAVAATAACDGPGARTPPPSPPSASTPDVDRGAAAPSSTAGGEPVPVTTSASDAPASTDKPATKCRLKAEVLALPHVDGRCDSDACKAAKGKCVWGGFGCTMVCALTTADDGTSCSDPSQCQGACVVDANVKKGTPMKGTCSATRVDKGCANRLSKGIALGHICID